MRRASGRRCHPGRDVSERVEQVHPASDSPAPASFTDSGHTTDSLEVVKTRISDQSAVLIDVREPGEYEQGHIASAVNIPMRSLADSVDEIPTDAPVIVYCASGGVVGASATSGEMPVFRSTR